MRNFIIAVVALLAVTSAASAAPATKAVTCVGNQSGAHTLVIGNCSFEGDMAKQVLETCKKDSDICLVQAHGRDNGHDIFIIDSVESVKLAGKPPLSTQELAMAKRCKAGKPCSLTCNRVHDAGRDDLIKAGACAE